MPRQRRKASVRLGMPRTKIMSLSMRPPESCCTDVAVVLGSNTPIEHGGLANGMGNFTELALVAGVADPPQTWTSEFT